MHPPAKLLVTSRDSQEAATSSRGEEQVSLPPGESRELVPPAGREAQG